MKLLDDMRLTKNFTMDEFANHLSDGVYIKHDLGLSARLQLLRDIVGSITVTSGYRTPDFNASIGGSSNSNHLKGTAADIKFDFTPWYIDSLKLLLSGIGFTNIGIYLNSSGFIQWIHVDIGKRWNEANGWKHFRDSAVKIYHV